MRLKDYVVGVAVCGGGGGVRGGLGQFLFILDLTAHIQKRAPTKKQIIKHFHQIAALVNIDIWLQSLTQTNKQLQEISLII